jgi:hypothetical protein
MSHFQLHMETLTLVKILLTEGVQFLCHCDTVNMYKSTLYRAFRAHADWTFILRRKFLRKRCATCLEKSRRRLIRLLSTCCRKAAFFSASGAALSQEVPTLKWLSNQTALWTPYRCAYLKAHDGAVWELYNKTYLINISKYSNLLMKL